MMLELEETSFPPRHATYEECMAIYGFKHGALVPSWQWMGFFGPGGIAVVRTIPNGWPGVPPRVESWGLVAGTGEVPQYILDEAGAYGIARYDKDGWLGIVKSLGES